jgi:2-aminoethylphosphonate-pyruvate transaminase
MLRDLGSRDHEFMEINRHIRRRLLEIAGAIDSHVCVPLQGSGTFVVEAMIGSLIPVDGKLLVMVNGAYGRRIATICERYARSCCVLETGEDLPSDPGSLDRMLAADLAITHVAVVHCETTSGILNPVHELAIVTARRGRSLLVDAMSAFGGIELDARTTPFDAVVASSNKCLQGVPGIGFAIVRRSVLERCEGRSPSVSLDLFDQWRSMEATAQWRFTPPTHVIAAFDQALREHASEGGTPARNARYRGNCAALVGGMRALGFETLLPDALQAPIIVTFRTPADPAWSFQAFYDGLACKGFVIYPGKLARVDSFRIGCIGDLDESDIAAALAAMRETLSEMGVKNCTPRPVERPAPENVG